jgi:hypothetical protein
MKKTICSLALIFTGFLAMAQSPDKMTYQSVIRNASNNLVTSSNVGMQMSILQGSPSGLAVFIERHLTTTNINGLATLEIGAGTVIAGSFSGIDWSAGPYFLKTEVDPSGGTTYSISGTTQLLSVPYALYAESSGDSFSGDYNDLTNTPTNLSDFNNDSGFITSPNDADSNPTNELQNLSLVGNTLSISSGNSVVLTSASGNTLDQSYDQGGPGAGRTITADAGEVQINTATANGIALRTQNTNTGVALIASSTNSANTFSAIQASTNSSSTLASGIVGNSSGAANGISGQVESTGTGAAGVYGNNLRTTGGYGTYGIGFNGVVGETNYQAGFGVYGRNYDAIGNFTANSVGTYGLGYVGIWGEQSDPMGFSVYANGDFGAAGTKAFYIDHPEAPDSKYLRHFSIESNEVLNVYRGNAVFDANGEAVVEMPSYFDAVNNSNCTYQLTPIGAYAPLFVKAKMTNGKFIIGGGNEGMEVSWTVQTERNDPYLQQNPEKREVEINKEVWNQGKYLQPELYNETDDKKIVKPLETGHEQTPIPMIENK